MGLDLPPLVELGDAITVHADGMSHCEVYDGRGHFYFFETRRDGVLPTAPLVRAVVLHLILPSMQATAAMRPAADALGLTVGARKLDS